MSRSKYLNVRLKLLLLGPWTLCPAEKCYTAGHVHMSRLLRYFISRSSLILTRKFIGQRISARHHIRHKSICYFWAY